VQTGESNGVLLAHTRPVVYATFNGEGNLIVTASRDKTARVWNVGEPGTIRVARLSLSAEPSSYAGRCPVTVKFTGSISVVGSGGKVKYQLVRSNVGRQPTPAQELTFDAPGVKEVSDTWRVPGVGSVRGWATLRILEPQEAESDKAEFRLQCGRYQETPTSVYLQGLMF
jgi:WD domain, G-beta repeat